MAVSKKKEAQFKEELEALGIDESIMEAVLEIHRNDPDLVPYECKRKYNIMRNEEKLRNLNLLTIKSAMKPPSRPKPVKRKIWTPGEDTPLEPVRKSGRIADIKPVEYYPYEPARTSFYSARVKSVQYTPSEPARTSSRIASIKPVQYYLSEDVGESETFDEILFDIKSDSAVPIIEQLKKSSDESIIESIQETKQNSTILEDICDLSLDQSHISKVCEARISAMAVHPGNLLLVAGGSNSGEVGFFMPGDKKTTIRLEPHTNIVAGCQFSGDKLLTCSYDCTVRMFDAETLQYNEVYSGLATDTYFRALYVRDYNELMLASDDGQVLKVDIRENKKVCGYPDTISKGEYGSLWHVHPNKIDDNYFITSSNNGNVVAWDNRNTKTPVDVSPVHEKTIGSARFDPIQAKRIVTVSFDNKVGILEFTNKSKLEEIKKFAHINETGRFFTKFQAKWHPSSDELFVIGSMYEPLRRIEIFNINGKMEHTISDENIMSIQSLVEFHPTINALISGNGRGYINIFSRALK